MTDNDYAEAEARFAANVQRSEAEMQQAGLDPDTGFVPGQEHESQRPAPVVDANLLAEATRLQTARDETGRRPFVENEQYRLKVEQMMREAFGADPVQPAAGDTTSADRAALGASGKPRRKDGRISSKRRHDRAKRRERRNLGRFDRWLRCSPAGRLCACR